MIIKFKNKIFEVHGIELQKNNFVLYTFNKNYNYEKLCTIEMPYNYNCEKLFDSYNGNILDLSVGRFYFNK